MAGADDADVFTTTAGGPVDRNNFRNRVWLPATTGLGLDGLRFHDLRHTAGTLAAQTGATTKELMARLGHASPQAAMVYQHAASDRDRRTAEGLAEMALEEGVDDGSDEADAPAEAGRVDFVPRTCPEEPDNGGYRRTTADSDGRWISPVNWAFVPSPHVSGYQRNLPKSRLKSVRSPDRRRSRPPEKSWAGC